MPDVPPVKPATGFPDAEKHNQKVASDLLKQDLVTAPIDTAPAVDALDKLAAEANKKGEEAAAAKAAGATKPDPGVTPPPAAQPDPGTQTPPTPDPAAEEAARKKAEVEAEIKKHADTIFKDSPTLPPGASGKSADAFSAIKSKAVEEIRAREAELEKLREEKKVMEEKLKNPVPPEIAKELEDHRVWRAKLDVEADPRFKEFDKQADSTREFIYSQLKKSPVVTDDIIAQIKKIGGPEKTNLSKLFEAIKDPTLQKIVESKVAEIEMVNFNKEQAIKTAKDNIQKYTSDRADAYQKAVTQHTTATQQRLDHLMAQLPWTKEKAVDEKADASTKKSAGEYNQFIATTKQQVADALKDDSAEMRAILLVGMAQLFNLQREHAQVKAELESSKKSLTEITEKWEKVKNSSTTRLRESGASTNGKPPVKPPAEQVNVRTQDALDTLAQQVMETRAAAGTASR